MERDQTDTGGIMDQDARFEFVVDEQYENEKGIFTVLSIHRNEMVIRWESGEEIRTDIELQRNIQARREWERLQKEKAAKAAKSGRKTSAAKATSGFKGFNEKDFKNSASGTRWRGRNQLGGAVTYKLPEDLFKFNSWAFANKPEMHWLDTDHQKRKSGENRAKFFVRLDPDAMFFGFSIGQPDPDQDKLQNWDAFLQWLGRDDNEKMVHDIAKANDLTVSSRNFPKLGAIKPVKEGWKTENGKQSKTFEKLPDYFDMLAAEDVVSIEIAKSISKKDALDSGKEIVSKISDVFSQLMPLYKAVLKP